MTSETATRNRSAMVLLALLVCLAVALAIARPSAELDEPDSSEADASVVATDRYNTFEHVYLTSSVLRVTASAFRPAPDSDTSFPTVDVVIHEVLTDMDAARRDPVLGLADAATMRTLTHGRLDVGRQYIVFANINDAATPPWRVALALDAETLEPAPGYGTPEARDTLERLKEIADDEPSMDTLDVIIALIIEQRAMQGLPTVGQQVVNTTPITDLLYGDVTPVGVRDTLDTYLAEDARERSLPSMRDEVIPGFAEALGVELVAVELAFVGGEHLDPDVVALGAYFEDVGVLGWSRVQDEVFAVIGLGPAGIPYTLLPRYADGTVGPPIPIAGSGPGQQVSGDLLAPSGGELTIVAAVQDDGTIELTRMGRLEFDEFIQSIATAGQPSPEG